MLSEHQSYLPAALSAFSAALAALIAGGPGRRFEISIHDASTLVGEFQDAVTTQTGFEEHALGPQPLLPGVPDRRLSDQGGLAGRHRLLRRPVARLLPTCWACRTWSNRPGFATRQRAADRRRRAGRDRHRAARQRAPPANGPTRRSRRRVPLVETPDMATLLASEVHRDHGAFGEVRIGAAQLRGAGAAAEADRHAAVRGGRRADGRRALRRPGAHRRRSHGRRASRPARCRWRALRVIDLTMGWAGPVGTRQVADLGAEVIKVEGRAYPDWWRGADYSDEAIAAFGYEKPLFFNWVNRNKIGITLDLTRPEGVALLLRPGEGRRRRGGELRDRACWTGFGLYYEAFRAARPDIVMMSMPAFGVASPWAQTRAYGSTLEHASGLPMRDRLAGRSADHEPHRLWRSDRRAIGLPGAAHGAAAPPAHRRGAVHRPLAGGVPLPAGRALADRAVGDRPGRAAHRQPASASSCRTAASPATATTPGW